MSYRLQTYQSPQEFWVQISPYLRKEEAKNNLILGLSMAFIAAPSSVVYQAALFKDEKYLGSMVNSSYGDQYNLIPSGLEDKEAAEFFLNEFLKTNIPLTATIAEKETADIFNSILLLKGRSVFHRVNQGMYSCAKVLMPEMEKGLHFRMANRNDILELGSWVQDFYDEVMEHESAVDGQKFMETKIALGQAYALEKAGKLVSLACISRDIKTSCAINYVYTPKEFRKKGYASLVTACVTQKALDDGKKEACLYTDMANPTSNKIYQEIGYKFIGHSSHVMYK